MPQQPRKLNTPTNKKTFSTLHFRDFGSSSPMRPVLYSVIHAQRARLWPTWRKINSCSKQMRRDRASVKFLSNEKWSSGHFPRGRRIRSQSFVINPEINPILYTHHFSFYNVLRAVHIPERGLCCAHLFCLSGILKSLRRSIYSLLCICWNYRHKHTDTREELKRKLTWKYDRLSYYAEVTKTFA